MKTFIGCDIGTTGIRAGVYDEEFALLGSGTGDSIIRTDPDGGLYQDPQEIYTETAKAVSGAVVRSGVKPSDITALSFDGQMAGIMGIGEEWNPVIPYDSWLDTRCSPQVARLKTMASERIIKKSGIIPSFNHGPKILWWRENDRKRFDRVRSFIQPSAYVAGRLCGLRGGDAFVDWSYLHFSGFADNVNRVWDEGLTSLFGVSRGKLPKILSPFAVIGETGAGEGKRFGLRPGTPVAAGCGDTASCLLGVGAVERGIAADIAGTAAVLALTVDRFLPDMTGLVYAARSVDENLWYAMSYINGGGMNLEWFKREFAPDDSFESLNRSIESIPPGSEGLIFIPHLDGRAYPSVPRMRGQWGGFTRNHTRAHFYRSLLEGTAYEYALYKESIVGRAGKGLDLHVRGVGGGAKSPVWNRIKADVLGCPYSTINREDIALLGQALIAAKAVGHVDDLRETLGHVISIEETFEPDRDRHEAYAAGVAAYRKMLEKVAADA
jgi:xylulokinase